MSSLAKIFVVANLVLAIMFCTFSMALYAKRVNFNERWQDAEKRLVETENKLKKEIAGLNEQNTKIKSDLDAKTAENNNRKAEFDRLSVSHKQVEAKAQDMEAERRYLMSQIQAKDEELASRASKIEEMHKVLLDMQQALEIAKQHEVNSTNMRVEAENQLNAVQEHFKAVMKEKQKIEDDLAHANWILERLYAQGIDLPTIITGGEALPSIPAKVLAVDKDVNLVMLSVGRNDGVKKGYTFSIYRSDGYVGKIRVEKVYEDMCAGVILKDYKKGDLEIQEGDDANTQLGH